LFFLFYQIVNALDVVKKYLNLQVLLFDVVNALSEFTGMRLNLKETNISTKHNRFNSQLAEGRPVGYFQA